MISPEKAILPTKFLKDQKLWELDQNYNLIFGQPDMEIIKANIRKINVIFKEIFLVLSPATV